MYYGSGTVANDVTRAWWASRQLADAAEYAATNALLQMPWRVDVMMLWSPS